MAKSCNPLANCYKLPYPCCYHLLQCCFHPSPFSSSWKCSRSEARERKGVEGIVQNLLYIWKMIHTICFSLVHFLICAWFLIRSFMLNILPFRVLFLFASYIIKYLSISCSYSTIVFAVPTLLTPRGPVLMRWAQGWWFVIILVRSWGLYCKEFLSQVL